MRGGLTIDNGQTLYLCLNGKEYKFASSDKINVEPGGCLCLCDCLDTGKIVGNEISMSRFDGCININGYRDQEEDPAKGYIFGGTITGGSSEYGGGVITVKNKCILSIYGGTITGGSSKYGGGGVHVMAYSVVNLYGGTITGNTSENGGGGLSMDSESVLKISGSPVVDGNTRNKVACNILMKNPSTNPINFVGELTEGAKLGITLGKDTKGNVYSYVFSSPCDTDYSGYFLSDDESLNVMYNSSKQLQMADGAPSTHTHVWSTEWDSDDTHHWHNCTAEGCDITDNAQKDGYAAHSGEDDGDCTTPVDCETCGYQIKNSELAHSYPDKWTAVRPGSTHTRKCQNEGCNTAITQSCVSDEKATCQDFAKCTICGGDCGTKGYHDFTAETVGDDYLKSAATCTAKAVYYTSCSVCGESSQGCPEEDTFESGEFDANNHTGNLSDWQYNANGHWKEYLCCHAQPDAGTHSYDNETDTTCNICGYSRTKPEVTFNSITVIGNSEEDSNGNWLHGADWAVDDPSNHMTETSKNVYEITYTGIAPGSYQFKFAANDGWTDSWGAGDGAGLTGAAVYGSPKNITFSVDTNDSTVKLVLDLSEYDPDTKQGATYTITVTPPHSHPICGATCADGSHTDQTWQAISTSEELSSATNGYYYLANDVTLENRYINDGVVLCLNGHSIKSQTNMPTIDVMFGRTFTLTDCTGKGTITHDSGYSSYGVRVYGGTFDLYGGSITGNGSGGVYVQHYEYEQSTSTFNMYGGSITGNKQAGGSGVDVDGGTFNLSGGSITGNTGTSFGGGVYAVPGSTVSISGNPVIEGNTVAGKADNLYLNDTTVSVSNMTSGAKIGVTTKDTSYPVVFSGVCDTNYSEYFFADDANAHVEYNSDKKLQLAHIHAWATAWTHDVTYHWHECANSGCDVTENSGKDGYSAHVYDNDTDATCNTCGYRRTILYTVTFNPNGGTLASGEKTALTNADGKLTRLPTPTRSGSYRFDGWYTEETGGDAITTDYKFSADTTVYAHWTYTGSSGSYTPSYAITVEKSANGAVSADRKNASRGTAVTITVTPDKGYTLETLTVTDKNGKEVKLTEKNGKYTFTMPASSVTVKATFMDDNTMLNFFVDVKAGDYFYDAVLWAVEKGITTGTTETTFSPNASCTRAQIVTFLWRATGSPEPQGTSSFTDVPADSYYAKAVAWAVEKGITTGTTETTFSPNASCTRAQAVAFLFRYAAPDAVTLQELVSGFSDAASVPGYALSAMNWALAAGIVQGDGSKLMPNDSCTRAQIVTFLYRALEK